MNDTLRHEFDRERHHLWALAYRMTGSAADADELVQEGFLRALERPPPDRERAWGPWLRTVVLNLARDRLRRRRAALYIGPWIPEPVLTDELVPSAEARHALAQDLTLAYLVALERLSVDQRAVLILREVVELSVRETARALSLSEANVKVLLHRARHALAELPALPALTPAQVSRAEVALGQLMSHVLAGRHEALRALFDEEALAVTDAGGQYSAARRPILGSEPVARYLLGIVAARPGALVRPLSVNGLPALWLQWPDAGVDESPRALVRVELGEHVQITQVQSLMAPRKLARVAAHLSGLAP